VPDTYLSSTASSKVDLYHPSVARVYDYLLGGTTCWPMDQSFGRQITDQFPEFRDIAKANRSLVDRVVRHLVRLGVRQFVDVGSGVLSSGNTHQIANDAAPGTKVVYVDNDAVAVAHAEILLDREGDPERHVVVNGDLRDPGQLWCQVWRTRILNQNEPVAVLMFSVLHSYSPESDGQDPVARLMARHRELIPAGSYLGISHLTCEGAQADLPPKLAGLLRLCDDWEVEKAYCRSRVAIEAFLGDFELVQPGMVWAPQWHPEESASNVDFLEPSDSVLWAGVGRKQPARQ
jgi:hypothetical protein